jgi:hypothetical protein
MITFPVSVEIPHDFEEVGIHPKSYPILGVVMTNMVQVLISYGLQYCS